MFSRVAERDAMTCVTAFLHILTVITLFTYLNSRTGIYYFTALAHIDITFISNSEHVIGLDSWKCVVHVHMCHNLY